jgi:hypothetical protein
VTAASSGPAVRQPVVVTPSPDLERWARRSLGRQVWFDSATVVVFLIIGAAYASLVIHMRAWAALPMVALFLICAGAVAWGLPGHIRRRNVARQLTGLQLWLHPRSVAYSCVAGTWSAGWEAVRRVQIVGRPGAVGPYGRALAVDVAGWGGPLIELGPVAHLSVVLEGSGVDLRHVADVVAEGSGGRLALLGVDTAAGGVEGRHVR